MLTPDIEENVRTTCSDIREAWKDGRNAGYPLPLDEWLRAGAPVFDLDLDNIDYMIGTAFAIGYLQGIADTEGQKFHDFVEANMPPDGE